MLLLSSRIDQCLIFCRTNFDCDNLEAFFKSIGGGSGYRGKVEKGKENEYSCLVLAGQRSMQDRREALQVDSSACRDDLQILCRWHERTVSKENLSGLCCSISKAACSMLRHEVQTKPQMAQAYCSQSELFGLGAPRKSFLKYVVEWVSCWSLLVLQAFIYV